MTPEVQRLRDIRLSNVNSLFLTGIANISRFEHSLGMAILADRLSNRLKLGDIEKHYLIAASMLHDAATPPFGHTVEYIFQQTAPDYSHDRNIKKILSGEESYEDGIIGQYTQTFGKEQKAFRIISSKKIANSSLDPKIVAKLILGETDLGKLIKSDFDLDNIDNIYRMAYHMGIDFDISNIYSIIDGYFLLGNQIAYLENNVQYLKKWLETRRQLYSELMPNQFDFSAKTMISYGVTKAIEAGEINGRQDWQLTDTELLWRLSQKESVAFDTFTRLKRGELFCIESMVWIDDEKAIDKIKTLQKRREIEKRLETELGIEIIVNFIHDNDKSSRKIDLAVITDNDVINQKSSKNITIGGHVNELLIGIFSKAKFKESFKREQNCKNVLLEILGAHEVTNPQYLKNAGSSHVVRKQTGLDIFL
ncbi:MAG: HD domain-containing protein [Methanoregula sp.]|uniref:HD domain-containing protein n=1 Tax=Methanoregula sp. TaxID=2052170 RepID=UPI003C73E6F6